jgi:hypothetical protein
MMEGDYSVLWGTSSLFDQGTYKVIKTGWLERTTVASVTFNVPEASFGGPYFVQFHQPNRDAVNAQFTVRPALKLTPSSTTSGSKVVVSGTGFPASDKGNLLILNDTYVQAFDTSSLGSFNVQLTLPDLSLGSHQIKAHSQKLSSEFVYTSIQIVSPISQQSPLVTTPPPATQSPPKTVLPPGGPVTVPVTAAPASASIPKPQIISPRRESVGWFGDQPVTFRWGAVQGVDGVSYNLEVGHNFSFSPRGTQKTGITATGTIIELAPGTYYWRVQAVDGKGRAGEWAYSPYPFKVGDFPIVPVAIAAVFLGILVYAGSLIFNSLRRYSGSYS